MSKRSFLELQINGAPVAWERAKDSADSADAMQDAILTLMRGDDASALARLSPVMAACARLEERGEVSCGAFEGRAPCSSDVPDEDPVTMRSPLPVTVAS